MTPHCQSPADREANLDNVPCQILHAITQSFATLYLTEIKQRKIVLNSLEIAAKECNILSMALFVRGRG